MVLGLFRSEIWISRPRVNYDTDLNLNRTRQLGGGMYSAEYVTKLTCCLITTQYRKLHKPTESTGCGVTRKTAKMGSVSGRTGGHNHVLARGRQLGGGSRRRREKGWTSFVNAGGELQQVKERRGLVVCLVWRDSTDESERKRSSNWTAWILCITIVGVLWSHPVEFIIGSLSLTRMHATRTSSA